MEPGDLFNSRPAFSHAETGSIQMDVAKGSVMDDTGDLRARVVALENWKIEQTVDKARHDERWIHMDHRFDRIEKSVQGLKDIMSRIMWIVIGGVIAGVVAFMMRGGFTI